MVKKCKKSKFATNKNIRLRKTISIDLQLWKKTKSHGSMRQQDVNLSERFEILETLGVGTYSYVKHAFDTEKNIHVAIKTCIRSTAREMLRSEYNILKDLDHPNIIKVHEIIENEVKNETYMIMEYFEGKTISKYAQENKDLSMEDSKLIVRQVLESLCELHFANYAHRDIKPDNVLINGDKLIKVIDFNISKATLRRKSESDAPAKKFKSIFLTQISSPLYCAPELKLGSGYTESVDIWGAGIIMFTLLIGDMKSLNLKSVRDMTQKSEIIYDLVDRQTNLDDEWKEIMMSLLAQDPEKRPSSFECLSMPWLA